MFAWVSLIRSKAASLAVVCWLSGAWGLPGWAVTAYEEQLQALEMKFFFHAYGQDNDVARLNRLEKTIFGQALTGSQSQRLERLAKAVNPDVNLPVFTSGSLAETTRQAPVEAARYNPPAAARETVADSLPADDSAPRAWPAEEADSGFVEPIMPAARQAAPVYAPDYKAASPAPAYAPSRLNDLPPVAPSVLRTGQMPSVAPRLASWSPVSRVPQVGGLVGQLENLEDRVFGKIYLDSVPNRLTRLENQVFPQENPLNGSPWPYRLQRLQSGLRLSADPHAGNGRY